MQPLETGFFHAAQFPRDSSIQIAACINRYRWPFGQLHKFSREIHSSPLPIFFFFFIAEQYSTGASLEAHLVKNLPIRQDTPVQFLGQEDLLEKEQATYSAT